MATCPFNEQLGAYHDGELDADRRAALDRHLPQCPACRAELVELAALSRLLAEAPQPRLSQMSMYRLHRAADAVMEDRLLRTARRLSAVAACALVVCGALLMLTNETRPTPAAPPPWVDVPAWAGESSSLAANTPAAAWYLADASNRPREMP
jgi:anti-sigma factor RsiW